LPAVVLGIGEKTLRETLKSIIFIFLNLLFILALLGAFFIYTIHLKFVPWFQVNTMGFQFLGLVFLVFPILIITGVGMLLLGKSTPVPSLGKILPFVMIPALLVPIIIGLFPLGDIVMPILVTLIVVMACILSIMITFRIMGSKGKQ
jgi:hypothetical protein